jgi:hypothetical protein
MIQAGILSERIFSAMRKAWKTAAFGMVLGTVLAPGMSFANPPNAKHIKYEFHQNNIYNGSYDIVREAMAPLYKGTVHDEKIPENPPNNPLIGIGEFDLNGDHIPEMIAYPTEDETQEGTLCKPDNICPFYIFEIRGKKIHTLGKIFASSIDRGDNITEGYWDLKIYSNDWTDPKPDEYELYTYNKKSDEYVNAAKAADIFKKQR